eukprot:570231-Pleurochrysis_carterae.AAC.1
MARGYHAVRTRSRISAATGVTMTSAIMSTPSAANHGEVPFICHVWRANWEALEWEVVMAAQQRLS